MQSDSGGTGADMSMVLKGGKEPTTGFELIGHDGVWMF